MSIRLLVCKKFHARGNKLDARWMIVTTTTSEKNQLWLVCCTKNNADSNYNISNQDKQRNKVLKVLRSSPVKQYKSWHHFSSSSASLKSFSACYFFVIVYLPVNFSIYSFKAKTSAFSALFTFFILCLSLLWHTTIPDFFRKCLVALLIVFGQCGKWFQRVRVQFKSWYFSKVNYQRQ